MANSTVVGFEELKRKLEKLGQAAAADKVLTAVKAGALLIENEAKVNCPVGKVRGGTLRRSLHQEEAQNLGSNLSAVDIGTDVVYAKRIEMGFSGRDSLGRLYNQAPNPFLRTAFDSQKEEARRETTSALKDLVDSAIS